MPINITKLGFFPSFEIHGGHKIPILQPRSKSPNLISWALKANEEGDDDDHEISFSLSLSILLSPPQSNEQLTEAQRHWLWPKPSDPIWISLAMPFPATTRTKKKNKGREGALFFYFFPTLHGVLRTNTGFISFNLGVRASSPSSATRLQPFQPYSSICRRILTSTLPFPTSN